MRKIKDRVLLGTIAGFISSGIVLALQNIALKAGWITQTWAEQAEGATVSESYLRSKSSAALGWLTSMFVDAFTGVAQTYIFSKTGKDQLLVKSTSMGVFSWLLLHGVSSRITQSFKADDSPPRTAFGSLISAILDCYISGVIITKLGDDSLFPDHDAHMRVIVHHPAPGSYRSPIRVSPSVNGSLGHTKQG